MTDNILNKTFPNQSEIDSAEKRKQDKEAAVHNANIIADRVSRLAYDLNLNLKEDNENEGIDDSFGKQ